MNSINNYDSGWFMMTGMSSPLEEDLKNKYLDELCIENSTASAIGLTSKLKSLPLSTLQKLYLALKGVLSTCSDSERLEIINALLSVDENQWRTILQQVNFIMPVGTKGHDVQWATEILVKITFEKDSKCRERLVNVANRFFKYNTSTTERGYILDALAKVDELELTRLDSANQMEREFFLSRAVPSNLKQGSKTASKTAFVYDSIFR